MQQQQLDLVITASFLTDADSYKSARHTKQHHCCKTTLVASRLCTCWHKTSLITFNTIGVFCVFAAKHRARKVVTNPFTSLCGIRNAKAGPPARSGCIRALWAGIRCCSTASDYLINCFREYEVVFFLGLTFQYNVFATSAAYMYNVVEKVRLCCSDCL